MSYSILFDGHCGLCHHAVSFVLKHDLNSRFIYISNVSEKGKKLLAEHGLEQESYHTLIVLDGDKKNYLRGRAIRLILSQLPKYRSLSIVLKLFPLGLLNLIYRLISKYRHRLGLQTCLVPTAEQAERIFL